MKKLMILCTMFLLASCSKTAIEEVTIGATDYEFTAYAPDEQADARTYVDDQMKLHWTKNDLITIFHGMLEPLKFGFRGETGATSGTYYNVDGIFYAPDQSAPNNVAVYPYSADHLLDENTRAVTLTMPAEQTYVENSFGLGANTMIAVTSEVNDLALYFKNVGTYLNVRLWGENQTVKTITVTATGGEALSGKAVVTPTYGGDPTCVMANTGTAPSVKLVCEEAVTVNTTEDAPVSFWIVLPPVTMASGFDVIVENTDGEMQVFTIDKSVTFKRNKYNTLTRELAVVAEEKIPNNEIHYTATAKVTPYRTSAFYATYLDDQSTYDSNTQKGVLKFDGDITEIGWSAFYGRSALTSVTIPNSVTSIKGQAFYGCSSLVSIVIPNSVTKIGYTAFYSCSSLASVTIPEGVTTIEEMTFCNCFGLTSITIPESVTTIGNYAFTYCKSLTSITIPESVTAIGTGAFQGCYSLTRFNGKFASSDGRCLIIDGTLNSFAPAERTSYTIPEGVITIGKSAFLYCSSLTSVAIPNSLMTIRDSAFKNCTSLTSVTIPENVTVIGEDAFNGCSSLTAVYCKPTTVPSLHSSSAFSNNASGRKIYVPASDDDSIINAYKSANLWKDYANYIVEYKFE